MIAFVPTILDMIWQGLSQQQMHSFAIYAHLVLQINWKSRVIQELCYISRINTLYGESPLLTPLLLIGLSKGYISYASLTLCDSPVSTTSARQESHKRAPSWDQGRAVLDARKGGFPGGWGGTCKWKGHHFRRE